MCNNILAVMPLFRGQFNRQGYDRGATWDTRKVLSVKDLSSFVEKKNMKRILVRIINTTLFWMEEFRAPMVWKRVVVERLKINEPISLSRNWVRSLKSSLQAVDKTSLRRDWVRVFVEPLRINDLPDYMQHKWRRVSEKLETTEYINHLRERFRSVLDGRIMREEFITSAARALWTLLATAFTKLFFSATAYTKQAVPCSLGGGEGVDLQIYKGNSKTFEVHVRDESLKNFSLDGATVYFMVKSSVKDEDSEALFTKSSTDTDQIEITDTVGGLCEVNILPADTDDLSVKRYVYDVKVETGDGEKYTVALGEFKVSHVVKRD